MYFSSCHNLKIQIYISQKKSHLYPEYLLEDWVESVLLHFRLPLASLAPGNIRMMLIVSANKTIKIIAPVNKTILIIAPVAEKTKHKIMIILTIIAPANITICMIRASAK